MYKCAIIGCGNIAGGYDREIPDSWSFTHAGAYHLCPSTQLIAAADVDFTARNIFGKKWGVEKLYKDYQQMLENEEVDIISLCLPTEYHFDAFKVAYERNIPAIFCEKPLSYDLYEAKEMVRMSEGRVVAVNYFRRWNSAMVQLQKDIKEGIYGRVINITARYTKGIFVNGSHLVDLLIWFLGEIESVKMIKLYEKKNKRDPGVDFTINFEAGITAYFLHIPDVDYVFIDIDILMERGRLVLSQRGQLFEKYDAVLEPYYQKFNILKKTEESEIDWKCCLTNAVEEIVECLNNGGQTSCTSADGFRSVEICHEAMSLKI